MLNCLLYIFKKARVYNDLVLQNKTSITNKKISVIFSIIIIISSTITHPLLWGYFNRSTDIHVQRHHYSIGQQTRAFGCAVTKAYTWRHGTWDVRWLNRMRVHPAHSRCRSESASNCSLGFPCVLDGVYVSVNSIMANQYFFTEQGIFIYDQYLLTQSPSQVLRLFEIRLKGVKIPSRSTVHNLYNKFQIMGNVEPKKQHKPRSVISVTKLTASIEKNYSELWEIL